MVGVPLSRGCETCRRRKIKCDESKPVCIRRTKSRLVCPGYHSRLKFMDEGQKFGVKACWQRSSRQNSPRVRTMPASPSEELAVSLYQALRADLPVIKNLASFSKTIFVSELPRHVGLSLACDLSMKALCLAHETLLYAGHGSLVQSRIHYGRALAELQLCIADPGRASTTGTLCATMLLSLFEQLLCTDFNASIRHAGGAARLIEAIGPDSFKEPFAYRMLNALQGPIASLHIHRLQVPQLISFRW